MENMLKSKYFLGQKMNFLSLGYEFIDISTVRTSVEEHKGSFITYFALYDRSKGFPIYMNILKLFLPYIMLK